MKTVLSFLLTGLCISLFVSASDSGAQQLSLARPYLAIEGNVNNDVSADILSSAYTDSLDRLEVTLNNWGEVENSGGVGYKYSSGNLLLPGTHVALYFGSGTQSIKLFEGTITTLAPHFESGKPPTLTFVATRRPTRPKQSEVTATFGRELLEFHPVLTTRSTTITCKGIAEGNPSLQMGTTLTVGGVGQPFARSYSVTTTKHVFDLTTGYRTEFTGSASTVSVP